MSIWASIPEYPEYEASTDGQIKSLPRLITRRKCSTVRLPEKIMSPVVAGRGYLTVVLRSKDRRYIHRLVAMTFIGPPPHDGAVINHIDGDKTNNRVDNLEWCTHHENQEHKVMVLKSGVGETHANTRLTVDLVREIRSATESSKALAFRIGVTPRTVRKIRKGTRWRWLEQAATALPA